MNEARNALHRRGAVALSSIAVTAVVCLGAVPSALADPYDDGDTTEVVDDSGSFDEPAEVPAEEPAPAPEEPGPVFDEPAPAVDEPAPGVDEPASEVPEGPDAAAPPEDPEVEAPDEPGPAGEPGPVGDPGDPGDPTAPGDQSDPGNPDTNVSDPDVDAETTEPDIVEAPQQDFDEAHNADAVDVDDPSAASEAEVTELTESLESFTSSETTTTSSTWTSQVSQWNSRWTGYDRWYRPVFTNPYSTPLQIIYPYGNTTRTFTVPPLQRAVLTAPTPGVYSFTAVNRDQSGKPVKVSTGSFSGGGYRPGPGQPPPPKPKPRRPSTTCSCNSSTRTVSRSRSGSRSWPTSGTIRRSADTASCSTTRRPRGAGGRRPQAASACSRSPAHSSCQGSPSRRKVRCRAIRCS